jgi:hypothetical protein
MFKKSLFLGVPIDHTLKIELSCVSPEIRKLFIQEGNPSYLQEAKFENQFYVGKHVAEGADFSSLELLESNILSLLNKLVPTYHSKTRLWLLTILQSEDESGT